VFEAPSIIKEIPDIKKIYEINDGQIEELQSDSDQLDSDIFFDTMSEDTTSHWERFLHLAPEEDDNLSTRRFRVKSKATERLPYSLRVFQKRLEALFGVGNYTLIINENLDHLKVVIPLEYAKAMQDAVELIENLTPLNMTYEVEAHSEREVLSDVFFAGLVRTVKMVGLRNETEYQHNLTSDVYASAIVKTFKTKEVENG
jgi:hypothetical protein